MCPNLSIPTRQIRLARFKGGDAFIHRDTLAYAGCAVAAQFLRGFTQARNFAFLLRFGAFHQRQGITCDGQVVGIGAAILFELMRKFIETQHFVNAVVKQIQVMRDDKQRAPVVVKVVHQPACGLYVKEVGRLVEQQ